MIKLFSSILLGFWENPKPGSAIAISSPKRRALNDFSPSVCDADNLADHQSYLTSTHTNCLIQLLKSVSIKSFVSTEAAHSTAALRLVKLFFEEFFFPLNRLRFGSTGVSRQREANHTASKTTVNHLAQPLPINPTEAANSAKPPPCQPGAFYSNSPSAQVLFFANLLI